MAQFDDSTEEVLSTVFDSTPYLNSLAHIGEPYQLHTGGFRCLSRGIDGSLHRDALGPLPYSFQLGEQCPYLLREQLQKTGWVSFLGSFAPGIVPGDDWVKAGFEIVSYKSTYLFRPDRPRKELSTRSRRNLRRARKHWDVRRVNLKDCWREVERIHTEMLREKPVMEVSRRPASSFEVWANLSAVETYAAYDEQGDGVWAIIACVNNELHLMALAAHERAYKTCGCYALYDFLTSDAGPWMPFHFGAVPAGQTGLARFKSRFSNAELPSYLTRIILRLDVACELEVRLGTHQWFPAYRSPYQPSSL